MALANNPPLYAVAYDGSPSIFLRPIPRLGSFLSHWQQTPCVESWEPMLSVQKPHCLNARHTERTRAVSYAGWLYSRFGSASFWLLQKTIWNKGSCYLFWEHEILSRRWFFVSAATWLIEMNKASGQSQGGKSGPELKFFQLLFPHLLAGGADFLCNCVASVLASRMWCLFVWYGALKAADAHNYWRSNLPIFSVDESRTEKLPATTNSCSIWPVFDGERPALLCCIVFALVPGGASIKIQEAPVMRSCVFQRRGLWLWGANKLHCKLRF